MNKIKFGNMRDGREVFAYTLKTDEAEVVILSYGAVIQTYKVGEVDIVGGFDKLETYFDDPSHQGGVVGRVANRIKNARFEMDGKIYNLTKNNGENSLHGGCGFDRRLWEVISYSDTEITLSYTSPDGEEGYPNEVIANITYTLIGASLMLSYTATSNGKTPISLTNHSYFNLDGLGGDVLSHNLQIFADYYTEADETLVPTGNRPAVDGTPLDFRVSKAIGRDIEYESAGYDQNMILSPKESEVFLEKELSLGAILDNGKLKMSVYTDQPCIQLYIGGGLPGTADFKGGIPAVKFGGICLETQIEQDAPNRGESFYEAGEVYTHNVMYKVEKI